MELQGNFWDYFIVFWSGVIVSFTPCVYPVLPLTASFIAGINTKGTKRMGFVLSLVYVFGLAVTYCIFGVAAALTGKVFGQIQSTPIFLTIVGCALLFFSLAMFDVIKLPSLGIAVNHSIKTKNIWTVILFGMASGIIVGPCTSPVLGPILFYVGSKQNILHAVSLLFVFSYGVGFSLILVGTFSGMLALLPKSGAWLLRVKQFCAIILLIGAAYFFLKAGGLL